MPALDSKEFIEEEFGLHGRTRYYLNKNDPWIAPLRILLECAVGGLDILFEQLLGIPDIKVAFVFGPFAISEQQRGSDIDLMIMGKQDPLVLDDLIPSLEKRIGREIQVVTYTPDEWRKAFEKRSHFVVSLMEAPKIYLVGNALELGRIALGSPA
jgi:predicted nucleotidyltransferase